MARTFDPFREMDRLFGEVTRASQPGLAMDLLRDGDHFVAQFDLPGVDPSSIDIDIDDRTLTVRAERKGASTESEEVRWLVRERASGTVARQLSLGRGIDTSNISADYTDGVLTLMIPVAEESKPRKIAVQHGSGNREIAPEVIEGETEKSDTDA